MNDGGFDFRKAPERKTPKPFEPPPWEKEAFDELKRKREQEVVLPADVPAPPAPPQDAEAVVPPVTEPRRVEAPVAEKPNEARLDERQVLEMLAGLAEQEPDLRGTTRRVAFVTAIALGALGMVLVVWGMAAIVGLRGKGPVGFAGGAVLELFGLGFLGAAAWLVYRTLKRQGVI